MGDQAGGREGLEISKIGWRHLWTAPNDNDAFLQEIQKLFLKNMFWDVWTGGINQSVGEIYDT